MLSRLGRPLRRGLRRLLLAVCLLAAGHQFGDFLYIQAKAQLAQYLLLDAWQQTLREGLPAKPWPWADTWPVARLTQAELGVDWLVLDGGHGESLAFGPGQLAEGAGRIIAGHRDTHFAFLQHLQLGDQLSLTDATGRLSHYRVVATEVADSDSQTLQLTDDNLLLVTCYPFDALDAGGPLRYVVRAEPLLSANSIAPNKMSVPQLAALPSASPRYVF